MVTARVTKHYSWSKTSILCRKNICNILFWTIFLLEAPVLRRKKSQCWARLKKLYLTLKWESRSKNINFEKIKFCGILNSSRKKKIAPMLVLAQHFWNTFVLFLSTKTLLGNYFSVCPWDNVFLPRIVKTKFYL